MFTASRFDGRLDGMGSTVHGYFFLALMIEPCGTPRVPGLPSFISTHGVLL
jgi:hypothetical protein